MERFVMGMDMGARRVERSRRPDFLAGFILPETPEQLATVMKKLDRFIDAGSSQIKTVWDFDRTVTWGTHIGRDATVLDYLSSRLPPRVRKRLFDVTDTMRPKEKDDSLTWEEAERWFSGPYNEYVKFRLRRKHRLTHDHLREFGEVAHPRYGVVSAFQKLAELEIPRIISSGGNENTIRLWHEKHNAPISDIVSTEFIINGERVKGWKKETLIHTLNKKRRTNDVLDEYVGRPLTILFGDSLQDADMVDGDENVLRIRIKPTQIKETEKEKQEYRRRTFEKFDLLLEEGDFLSFLDFLDALSGKAVPRQRTVEFPLHLQHEIFPGFELSRSR